MTKREVIEMLTAKAECIRREASGTDIDCNLRNCDECDLCYKQGTTGDQMEALRVAISALQAQDLQPICNELAKDTISRQAAIDTEGLDEQIKCEMCRNPMHTVRGCDGNCKYDERLYERIMQILDERIKPLPSAQPNLQQTCNNLATDTISRQVAIRKYQEVCNGIKCGECPFLIKVNTEKGSHLITDCKLEAFLHNLPSAQRTQTDTSNTLKALDCVERRAAIDAAIKATDDWDGGYNITRANMIEKELNELPSAQPEPTTEIQEILNYLDTTLHPIVSPDNWYAYAELYDMVSSLPTAQHWISCSERLPEEDEQVFVYLFDDSPYIAWICGGRWHTEEFTLDKDEEPVAWMPLPESYLEEGGQG